MKLLAEGRQVVQSALTPRPPRRCSSWCSSRARLPAGLYAAATRHTDGRRRGPRSPGPVGPAPDAAPSRGDGGRSAWLFLRHLSLHNITLVPHPAATSTHAHKSALDAHAQAASGCKAGRLHAQDTRQRRQQEVACAFVQVHLFSALTRGAAARRCGAADAWRSPEREQLPAAPHEGEPAKRASHALCVCVVSCRVAGVGTWVEGCACGVCVCVCVCVCRGVPALCWSPWLRRWLRCAAASWRLCRSRATQGHAICDWRQREDAEQEGKRRQQRGQQREGGRAEGGSTVQRHEHGAEGLAGYTRCPGSRHGLSSNRMALITSGLPAAVAHPLNGVPCLRR